MELEESAKLREPSIMAKWMTLQLDLRSNSSATS